MDDCSREGRIVKGRYEVLRQIGAGAMGAVYVARDLQSGAIVALKEISPALLKVPGARERFKNEITAVFRVNHPSIVRGIDFVDEADCQALIVEYVEGKTLAAEMQGRTFTDGEVVHILQQLALGLSAVHGQGIVHRDLKPENILVAADGSVKISDFGVAGLGGDSTLTQQGRLVGTAKYFSPEYIETGECDARGDFYALGVLGFELLSGMSPFRATRLQDLMMERFNGTFAADLTAAAPRSSPQIRTVIVRLLSVSVAARYQNAEELLRDLEIVTAAQARPVKQPQFQANGSNKLVAPRASPSRTSLFLRVAVVVVVLFLAAVLILVIGK